MPILMTGKPREPKCHELKCWPEHFQAVIDGIKTTEVRLNDRDYRVGDVLLLKEWNPKGLEDNDATKYLGRGIYTGRDIFKTITHIIDGFKFEGVSPGYVVLSIKEPE